MKPSWISAYTVVNLDCTDQPCSYSASTVDYSHQNLTTFPPCRETNISVYNLYIYIRNNFIETIPEEAFKNMTKNTNVLLFLDGNNLSRIATTAFQNIEGHVSIDNNDFVDIPSEPAVLPNIQTLYFRNNPLTSQDRATVQVLVEHLNEFYFDMQLLD